MSRKPPKKSTSPGTNPTDAESVDEPEPRTVANSETGNNATFLAGNSNHSDENENDDFDEEEFSLDQLSQAYAEVLKQNQSGTESPDDLPRPELGSSQREDTDVSEPDDQAETEFDDDAACPISPESIIESILFVGAPKDVKLTSRKIAAVLRDVSPKEVTKIVRELNEKYEQEDAAYRVESDGGVFKMVIDPKLQDFQREFFGRNREVRLSQAAIDVMAVVAYNQPTTREQVEKIRSRPSGSVLAQLVRRELLSVEPGETNPKVKYYSTTDRFLDLFNLDEIADLPQSHEVSDIEELAD